MRNLHTIHDISIHNGSTFADVLWPLALNEKQYFLRVNCKVPDLEYRK